jgi:DtxR family Mn-dependent transcriptional regulator
MDSWKEFGQTPVTHSAAHHMEAVADLIDEYGYARVTDVARKLSITRGSVSITIKNLKQRRYVTQDSRGFLRLTKSGEEIVRAVQARKAVLLQFFTDILGLDADDAAGDACKIEHLISNKTAGRITRFLRFIESDAPEARAFLHSLKAFDEPCGENPGDCPCCDDECLSADVGLMPEREEQTKK